MLICMVLYIVALLVIGVVDSRKIKDFEDFAVAGKKQGEAFVLMSLMATMVGASATVGIMGRVSSIGFPAFWWLAVGSVGLLIQSVFLSEKIRSMDADTLPDLVGKLVGRLGKLIVAVIIVISWPGIVASQILAMSSILAVISGKENNKSLMLAVAIVAIIYTAIGGQLSVIKTDALQFIIISVAFVAAFIYLFLFGQGDNNTVLSNVELLNDNYKIKDLLIQLFVVGGTYLLGPDVISRNLVSKDAKTAKKAARYASIILLFFSIMVVLIGLWITNNVEDLDGMNPLIYSIEKILPTPIGVLLAIGLLSTILSSADTCLVNISSIIEIDILKRNKVWELRFWAVIIGAISVVIAFYKGDIITMLSGAYSVYAPGIVCPLFIAILAYGKRKLCIPVWLLGVAAGGVMGAYSTYIDTSLVNLPIIGMGISLAFGILSIVLGSKAIEKKG